MFLDGLVNHGNNLISKSVLLSLKKKIIDASLENNDHHYRFNYTKGKRIN